MRGTSWIGLPNVVLAMPTYHDQKDVGTNQMLFDQRSSRGRLATNLPLLPRRLQLPIPVGVDLLLTPGEHVLRRDVADRTVQAWVMPEIRMNSALGAVL